MVQMLNLDSFTTINPLHIGYCTRSKRLGAAETKSRDTATIL